MCGIAGIYYYDKLLKVNQLDLKIMSDTIKHRGPDKEGYFINNNIGLAHRRLAIIDLNTGDQPLISDDGSIALIFNGEIYNYIEIKNELILLGHHFHTTSDTEVLLKAYQQWGLEFHSRLNGMWALALWDNRKQHLLLSRDRMGEKPLHYAEWNGKMLFGSEIKSILASGFPPKINLEVFDLYLTFSYVPAPYSFYKNINKLKPGHYLLVKNGRFEEICYWELPVCEEREMRMDRNEIEEEFESLLEDSVKIRLRSDVAFGAFLSGGLDSSSIVALMAKENAWPIETFTIGFENKYYDERPLARLVSKKFGTKHHEDKVIAENLELNITQILDHCDEPFGDSSAIPTGRVSEYARQYVKMALSGDGGDEVLSGYNAYQSEKFASILSNNIPKALGNIPDFTYKLAAIAFGKNIAREINKISRIYNTSFMSFEERLFTKASLIERVILKEVLKPFNKSIYDSKDYLINLMKSCPFTEGFYRLMWFNLKLSLPEDMLVKVDRMSMAHSIEVRVPFLDHRLIEMMVKVHKNVKMRGFERKSILRNTIAKNLPSPLLKARKMGFSVPLFEWFNKDTNNNKSKELLNLDRVGLNTNPLAKLLEIESFSKVDNGNILWMILILSKWLEKNKFN